MLIDQTATLIPKGTLLAWLVLIASGLFEAVWAIALGRSEGLTRWVPTAVFICALGASMLGLAIAMRDIPVGTAYAVWVGVGVVTTTTFAMAFGGESRDIVRVALIALLAASIAGLKVTA